MDPTLNADSSTEYSLLKATKCRKPILLQIDTTD